jgi:hypothetical protein
MIRLCMVVLRSSQMALTNRPPLSDLMQGRRQRGCPTAFVEQVALSITCAWSGGVSSRAAAAVKGMSIHDVGYYGVMTMIVGNINGAKNGCNSIDDLIIGDRTAGGAARAGAFLRAGRPQQRREAFEAGRGGTATIGAALPAQGGPGQRSRSHPNKREPCSG